MNSVVDHGAVDEAEVSAVVAVAVASSLCLEASGIYHLVYYQHVPPVKKSRTTMIFNKSPQHFILYPTYTLRIYLIFQSI